MFIGAFYLTGGGVLALSRYAYDTKEPLNKMIYRQDAKFAKKRAIEFKQKILGVLGVLAVQEDFNQSPRRKP